MEKSLIHSNELHFISKKRIHQAVEKMVESLDLAPLLSFASLSFAQLSVVSSLAQEVRSFLANFFAHLTLGGDARFLPLRLAVHHDDAGALIAQFSLIDSMPLAQQGWLNSMKM